MMHWAQPQEGTLTYVALGDSAGVGVGVDEPGQGYVGVIARRLAEVTGETVRVVNLSTYGAKAKNVLDAQLPKLAEVMAPDFATCVIGSNDVAWSPAFKTDDFARDMTAIASKLSQGTVMGLVPNFLHWPYDRRANKANQAIRHAAGLQNHAIADLDTATKALSLREYLGTFAGDYFHPNATGHALYLGTAHRPAHCFCLMMASSKTRSH